MVAVNTMGAAELLRKYLESDAGSGLLAEMVKMAAELLMDADVDVLCNADYGERTEERLNSRNGHRKRRWDTRAGTITLEIPKLRSGSYFPSLLEPRRRAEQALVSVVTQAYVEGISTRRVDDLVAAMGIEGMSKSQVRPPRASFPAPGADPSWAEVLIVCPPSPAERHRGARLRGRPGKRGSWKRCDAPSPRPHPGGRRWPASPRAALG